MPRSITYTKVVSNFCIRFEDLKRIHNFFYSIFIKSMAEEAEGRKDKQHRRHSTDFETSIYYQNSTHIKLSADHQIDENDFARLRTERIKFKYRSFISGGGVEDIEVTLTDGNLVYEGSNSISIQGPSDDWVNAQIQGLENLFESFKRQPLSFIHGRFSLLIHIFSTFVLDIASYGFLLN